jgi:hypothetical protein
MYLTPVRVMVATTICPTENTTMAATHRVEPRKTSRRTLAAVGRLMEVGLRLRRSVAQIENIVGDWIGLADRLGVGDLRPHCEHSRPDHGQPGHEST